MNKIRSSVLAVCGLVLVIVPSMFYWQHHTEKTLAVPREIVVFAAAGTSAAMTDLAAAWQTQTGVTVRLNLASSSVLAKQINAGADFDLFISANQEWMDAVAKENRIVPQSRIHLLKDQLAVIIPSSSAVQPVKTMDASFFASIPGDIAVGDPSHVPAGIYARQALEHLDVWDSVKDRLIPAANVQAAQQYVESGQCPVGIVYLSGAVSSSRVKVIHVFDESLHEPIFFSAAQSSQSSAGRDFLAFLKQSQAAVKVYRKYGFTSAESAVCITGQSQ